MKPGCLATIRTSCVAVLLAASAAVAATGRVTAIAGSGTVTLSLGGRDGVEVGMTGQVRTAVSAGDRAETIPIASFRITQVKEQSSVGELTEVGAGFRVEPGNEVVFDRPLTARPRGPATRRSPATSDESPSTVSLTPLEKDRSFPALGIRLDAVSPSFAKRAGITEWEPRRVVHVHANGPAAGILKKGDVLLEQIPVGDPATVRVWREGQRLELKVGRGDASLIFKTACLRRDALGCTHLGELLLEPDAGGAFAYFQKACRGGDMLGCRRQAEALILGRGTAPDPAAGWALMRKSCDQGLPDACASLGYALTRGVPGVVADTATGLSLLERGCTDESARACHLLGRATALGKDTATDAPRAAELFGLACEAHFWEACGALAGAIDEIAGLNADPTRALALLGHGCDSGQRQACFIVGNAHSNGKVVGKDLPAAAAAFGRACSMGLGDACSARDGVVAAQKDAAGAGSAAAPQGHDTDRTSTPQVPARGRVLRVAGTQVTLSLGSRHGIAVGMTGQISRPVKVGDAAFETAIATFSVATVEEWTCEAHLVQVGQGRRVKSGHVAIIAFP